MHDKKWKRELNINLQSLSYRFSESSLATAMQLLEQINRIRWLIFIFVLLQKNKSEQFVNIRCESENRVNTDMQQIYFSLIYHKSERKRNLSKQDDKAIALCSYQDKSNSLQFKMAPSFIQNNLSLQY